MQPQRPRGMFVVCYLIADDKPLPVFTHARLDKGQRRRAVAALRRAGLPVALTAGRAAQEGAPRPFDAP